MKAINATPKELRKIFADSYVIPDFQRPYSWEQEQCDTLWEDIVGFHNSVPEDEDKYFLGNIVVHPMSGGKYAVIDGQQRLTTLLLLIKALHTRAGTLEVLESCLRIQDKLTDKLTDALRVQSEVIAEDAETLRKIVFDETDSIGNSKLAKNYIFFVGKIDEWRQQTGLNSDTFNALIETLLYKIVLLPIECGSEDDALTIFQTINDRGMSLTDADIFKAKLYHSAPEEKRVTFVENWNTLSSPERLFRIYMHIVRANNGDTGKEIGLRAYFTDRKTNLLSNWEAVMASLKKINAIEAGYWLTENYGVIDSFWAILETYPNQYWNYPIYVFLHKYGIEEDMGFTLPDDRRVELEMLFEESVKYYFIKGIADNSVNTVKDVTFRMCKKIASGDDYIAEFETGITVNDRREVSTKLKNGEIGRYTRGIVVLTAYLNPKQDKEKLSEILWNKYDIEHILPKEWNHYDGWTEDFHKSYLNQLGNLMPLERAKNIKAQNEYLRKKKVFYATSVVQDALDMCSLPDSGWTPEKVQDKQQEKMMRLVDFFRLQVISQD
jgi:hypothetical protein